MRKLFDNLNAQRSLDPDVRTDDGTGENVVDSQGYTDGMLLVVTGDVTDTTTDNYTVRVMECDTSTGSFTTTGIEVSLTSADGDDLSNRVEVARIKSLNVTRKRFLRADLVCSATTTSFEGGAVIVLGGGADGPENSD